MTKKEFFEENYLSLLNQAKDELGSIIYAIINKINEVTTTEEAHINLFDFGISQPIYREDLHNDEMTETINSAFIDDNGQVGFEVTTFDSGYEISIDDLNMDMILYLIGVLDDIDVENLELS
tara:strand:+ start:1227 stop:1592 length:366 start_codon:yes stop_codon:yes gene_type:complete